MFGTRLTTASVATLATAGALLVPGTPAVAWGQSSAPLVTWAYTDSESPRQPFVDPSGPAPVGTWYDDEGNNHTSRSYFTYDVSRYAGKILHAATFWADEVDAEDCNRPAPVELWVTEPVAAETTWRNPPTELSRVGLTSMGGDKECPSSYGFDITSEVRAAVADGQGRITFALRIQEGSEQKDKLGRRFRSTLALSVTANTPPETPVDLRALSKTSGCGTEADPVYVGGNPQLTAWFGDADSQDRINATFAWWPVDDESARQEGVAVGSPGLISYQHSWQTPIPEGRYAWAARSSDGHDKSLWSQTCYFTMDRHRPAVPVVTSDDYPGGYLPHGGPGVPGTFRIDPNGSDDVVEYRWSMGTESQTVTAPELGAGVELEIAPSRYGTNSLSVWSIDRAGSRSAEGRYEFTVADTAPEVTVDMGGVDLPSRMTMKPGVDGVTEYRYRIGDGPEASVPAEADGSATAEIVFTEVGNTTVAVSNYTAAGLAGTWTDSVRVTDAPEVTSASYNGSSYDAWVGEPLVFTFAPRRPGVVRYEYRLDASLESVSADADGTATVSWTPTEPNYLQMIVRSIHEDDTTSEWTYGRVNVSDARPYVWASLYSADYAGGGVGVEDTFSFYSDAPGVVEFVVQLNGGPEIVAPAYSGCCGDLVLAPDRAGENALTVRSRFADGTMSPAREWTFLVAG